MKTVPAGRHELRGFLGSKFYLEDDEQRTLVEKKRMINSKQFSMSCSICISNINRSHIMPLSDIPDVDIDPSGTFKYILIKGFGQADHSITVDILKKQYPDYHITFSNEGY
ncbi:Janus/Ocnus family protein [Teladorsagia circumcincta]|uniref:Janus/Ocnus family protein n=1 Tax=Teladorsagia circumcincta TaxID=45464 RepID=A0A2G9UHP9_TELCI|nr:Janus/Ocnus family protein [Teladorsagia circumcincta]